MYENRGFWGDQAIYEGGTTMVEFGRDLCSRLPEAERREWLVTNGIGGYAMGTVAGLLTRRYHGLLVAALKPPLGRTLLVAKLDERATYDDRVYPLFANRWAGGTVEPTGFHFLESFRLEGSTPVWSYALGDALLEKRIWMQHGANTTYVQYHLARATAPLTLSATALVNHRDYHSTTKSGGWRMQIEKVTAGLRIIPFDGANPVFLLSGSGELAPRHEWYHDYFLSLEEYRGQSEVIDAHLYAGVYRCTLQPGESASLVASTEAEPRLDDAGAYVENRERERELLNRAAAIWPRLLGRGRRSVQEEDAPQKVEPQEEIGETGPVGSDLGHAEGVAIRQLVLAADQFIVRRVGPDGRDGRTIIAGYPWFGDWGRDTMIALPGLALRTGRPQDAARILHTFARYVDRGMLPNRFPDLAEAPEYNTVDATLWYFEAIRAYYAATRDERLLRLLFPVLQAIIMWHIRGTRYNIRMDPADGLIYAGEEGVQLTWMDAKVGGRVVTPRIGKPVEINALWFNALSIMAGLSQQFGNENLIAEGKPQGLSSAQYGKLVQRARASFGRFWNEAAGYCYDVIDGPDGDSDALRPNQLLAVSLHHSPLSVEQRQGVVAACGSALLTSHGLRSLAPDDVEYAGNYGGDQERRDGAYHQGSVWAWLIGPFVKAHLRVYEDRLATRTFLRPLIHHLADHGLGSISEIFDGDPPFTPRGCPAQAWSVAEFLDACHLVFERE
jgi:glycogen debranching enzyme